MKNVRRFWLVAVLVLCGCGEARGDGRRPPANGRDDAAASLEVLKQALTSKDYATRLLAVQAIGDVRAFDLVGWLERMLADPEHDVRVATVDVLGRAHTPRARQLLRSVRDDKTEALDIRALAASALLSRTAD